MTYTGCRPLSDDEVCRLLDACQGRYRSRDVALIVMGLRTGFRIKEILSLRVCDVYDGNEIAKVVRVSKGNMKGKKKARTMPLHESVREALLALLQSSRMWHPLFRTWALFHAQGRSTRISTRQAFGIIVSAASKAGLDIERIGTHSMRKTFAKNMYIVVNHDMGRLARLLGHENFSNTLRYLEFGDELDAAVLA